MIKTRNQCKIINQNQSNINHAKKNQQNKKQKLKDKQIFPTNNNIKDDQYQKDYKIIMTKTQSLPCINNLQNININDKFKNLSNLNQINIMKNLNTLKNIPKYQKKSIINPQNIKEIQTQDDSNIINQSLQLIIKDKDPVELFQPQILEYLKNLQQIYRINQDYIKFHKKLNPSFRNNIIKFLFKVWWKFKCNRKTIHLAVYCFDFYMSNNFNIEDQAKIISLAQAAIHIAMKYEEIYPPSLKQWTDQRNFDSIIKSESEILSAMNFQLNLPSIAYFQEYLLEKSQQVQLNKLSCSPHSGSSSSMIIKKQLNNKKLKVQLISDICLFDTTLFAYSCDDLARNIIRLVNNIDAPFKQERIMLNIKWAIERNSQYLDWLKQTFYKQLRQN